jgi:hypothetical protein
MSPAKIAPTMAAPVAMPAISPPKFFTEQRLVPFVLAALLCEKVFEMLELDLEVVSEFGSVTRVDAEFIVLASA